MANAAELPRPLPRTFFERDALVCAKELIGHLLCHRGCSGRIIETEAYREHGDPACHLFTRPSARAFAEKHPPGTAYVYLNYGVHWLTNVLCRDSETGESGFVLFRALDPEEGVAQMEKRRNTTIRKNLCSGPGKLSAALAIGPGEHGASLVQRIDFSISPAVKDAASFPIETDKRVGISSAKENLWRFLAKDHPGVSVKAGKVR